MKAWWEEFKVCGLQWNFNLGPWMVCLSLWPECPPCTGSWFGCWHHDENGHEIIAPITDNWSIHFSADKDKP